MNVIADTLPLANEPGGARTGVRLRSELWRHVSVLLQLGLAAIVVHVYALGGPNFPRLFDLAVAGFAVNVLLPMSYRLPFFAALSVLGALLVFGVADAAWLLACTAVLAGVCHLPWGFRIRCTLLLLIGSLLAFSRAGFVPVPWSGTVWPVLGSMFMFRLVLYALASKHARPEGGAAAALAYFFMLPNLAFPLFPVVDFQTFRRTYFDRPETTIYQQGLLWISRGLVHLLLYRIVYQVVLIDATDVLHLGDLVRFMLGTFLLYLRISGQFHLCVGLLHLFGFRLPETHKLYYLAHSFTDLWRRINIYWTDFMSKVVFYPTYFRIKRLGPPAALAVSTICVFAATWVLHSYQWFWLRGGFPITLQDGLFWGVLGVLVVFGALRESASTRRVRPAHTWWSTWHAAHVTLTFAAFCFLWSLWSTDSVPEWFWMLSAVAYVDQEGVILLLATLGLLFVLGGVRWKALSGARASRWYLGLTPAMRATVPLVILLVVAVEPIGNAAPEPLATALHSLQDRGMNARDETKQDTGYYEQLEAGRDALAAPGDVIDAKVTANPDWVTVLNVADERRKANWQNLAATGLVREQRGFLTRDLYPMRSILWNGRRFSTNRWGMRDQDYTLEKPSGTVRIALLGPSFVMGSGVSDGQTFEALVEERLNREWGGRKGVRFEILNFALEGQTLPEQMALLEDRVFEFGPDVVISTYYYPARAWTERFLSKLIWQNAAISDAAFRKILTDAGLDATDGNVTVPFSWGRALARGVGIRPRIPAGESLVRIRRITDDVIEWALLKFVHVTVAHGSLPVILGLNSVVDHAPPTIPTTKAIHEARVQVIDLFDLYPEKLRPSLRVAPWDHHPNAAGHRLIADRLYPELIRVLDTVTPGRNHEAVAVSAAGGSQK